MSHPFTSTLLEELGRELGITVELEPRFRQVGMITTQAGKHSFFKLSTLDCNPSGSAKIAADKDYASYFLHKLGYTVPEGEAFFSDTWCTSNKTRNNKEAALTYAAHIGFPVIVKPNSKAQGIGVTKVYTVEELANVLDKLFLLDPIVLVQKVVRGKDYRLIVYKESVPIAYERRPLAVMGDGSSTVAELMAQKSVHFVEHQRNVRLAADDTRILERLAAVYGFAMSSVPIEGQVVQLLDNANMSSGGEARDVSDLLHPSYKDFAVRLTRDMGLTLCGVDLMTENDVTTALRDCVVIEINDRPGLEHYSSLHRDARTRTKALYSIMLTDLVVKKDAPVVS